MAVRANPINVAKNGFFRVLAGLPSAVIYIAAPGDDLWSIGRKYHMPVKTVRELNALESDELRPGQKVLLVKGLA